MTDQPKVDPTDLHMSSDHMVMHHAEWQAATTALCTDVAAHGAAFRTARRVTSPTTVAIDPGAPTNARPEVQLTSFGSLLAPPPLTPSTTTPWWLGGGNDTGGGLFGASIAPNALIAEVGGGGAGFNIFNPFGPGGWLIGNGLDAQAGCVGAACPCGSGRILFGDGGAGLDGGHGGTGGLFCGTGGAGGQGGTGTNGAGGGDKGTDGGQRGVGDAGGGGAPSA